MRDRIPFCMRPAASQDSRLPERKNCVFFNGFVQRIFSVLAILAGHVCFSLASESQETKIHHQHSTS